MIHEKQTQPTVRAQHQPERAEAQGFNSTTAKAAAFDIPVHGEDCQVILLSPKPVSGILVRDSEQL